MLLTEHTWAVWQAHESQAGGSYRCCGELDQALSKSIVSHQLLHQGALRLWGASLPKPERQEVQQGPDVWGASGIGPPKPMEPHKSTSAQDSRPSFYEMICTGACPVWLAIKLAMGQKNAF